MANHRISNEKRAMILAAMCEGLALNSICRVFKVGKHAVLRVIEETGKACEAWHDDNFRNLKVQRLEVDEQWSYIGCHKERIKSETPNPDWGDHWLWAGIDADSKAIVGWMSGDRTAEDARALFKDLASRIDGEVQICTDELPSYCLAVYYSFGDRCHYVQENKVFGEQKVANEEIKRGTNRLVRADKKAMWGTPNLKTATINHIERFFLTVRQGTKRCARKTLAYSKTWGNHRYALSILILIYNCVRRNESHGQVPAVVQGVLETPWTLESLVAMTEAYTEGETAKTAKAKAEEKRRTQDELFEQAFAAMAL